VPHPFVIDATTLQNVKAHVLSPFEAVITDLLPSFGPCVPVDGERVRHSELEIPIPLDPFTDYVLDIEAVNKGAPPSTVGQRVFRRNFSTGAFATLDDFAISFQGASTEHRFAQPGALQAIGNDPRFASRDPEGAELDAALIGAGLEPLPVPRRPRIVVFWQQASPADTPQPAAVLIDASEPMHRLRPLPSEETSTGPQSTKRYKLTQKAWLTLEAASGSDAIIDKTIWAPGRQRALVTLKAGSRGKRLRLSLTHLKFTDPYLDGPGATPDQRVIVDEVLLNAPWEEL
jgi:hypothetical protein